MKKLIILIIAVLTTAIAFAQGVSNRLVVEAPEGMPFILRVDGFARNKKPQERVVVNRIYSSVVRISIEFADSAYAAVHNYQVSLTRRAAKDADSMMKGYEAYLKVKPGKKKSRVTLVSVKPVQSSPERYVPAIPDKVKKAKKHK